MKLNERPATIVGIIDHMQGYRVGWNRVDRVLLAPRLPFPDDLPIAHYIVRVAPGQRDAVMRSVEQELQSSNGDRLIEWVRPLELFKNRSYAADRNMGIFLVAVILMLLAITCIGVFGITRTTGVLSGSASSNRASGTPAAIETTRHNNRRCTMNRLRPRTKGN